MMFYLLNIIVIWRLLAMAAMVNGAVRDKLIAPAIGQAIALPCPALKWCQPAGRYDPRL